MDEQPKHRATDGGSAPPDAGVRGRIGGLMTAGGGLPALVLGLLIIAALIPGARALDAHDDRQRPMYNDIERLHTTVDDTRATTADLSSQTIGATGTDINGEFFRPSDGVTLQLKVDGSEYCVKARNQYDDSSRWDCVDLTDG